MDTFIGILIGIVFGILIATIHDREAIQLRVENETLKNEREDATTAQWATIEKRLNELYLIYYKHGAERPEILCAVDELMTIYNEWID